MAKQKPNWNAWGLKFIGSLVYLYVAWALWGASSSWFANISTSLATLGLALVFTVAVLSAVSFFLLTVASASMNTESMSMWAMKHSMMSGFTLFLLTLVPNASGTLWSWVALFGYVLAYIGLGMEMNG